MADRDLDFSDIEAKYHVQENLYTDNIIVVDGLPIIDRSKEPRLLARVAKEFTRKGVEIHVDDIWIPWDNSTGKSKGFVFIEFPDAQTASVAVAVMHGLAFDVKHRLQVNPFDDIPRYSNLDIVYVDPEPEDFNPKEHLRSWLADPQGRDQYVTHQADEVTVNWHGKRGQSSVAHKRPNGSPLRTELYVAWSPLGSYLVTLHQQGIRLWGGTSFEPLQRFRHPFVLLIDFSPGEKYLITWSQRPITLHEDGPQSREHFSPEDEGNNIAVWNVRSGALLRTFPASSEKADLHWPALKWSPDEKYVARITLGRQISVYELPRMALHDKKSTKIEGVVDFEWRPITHEDNETANQNMLAYWTPEAANQPARVTLMDFPSRSVLRQKNLFNCSLHWQSRGDFLCVKIDRHTKSKKKVFSNLEIFFIRAKDIPVQVVELEDTVLEFSWEPTGDRFAIITSNDPNPISGIASRTDVSFYHLDHSKGDFRLLRTLPALTSNTIRWSPRGRFVVLATVGSPTKSELLFWDLGIDVDDTRWQKTDGGSGLEQIGSADHYGVTDVDWDPSGRYLTTSASAWKHQLENGYIIWNFRGEEIKKDLREHFKQFIWRPRPPSLLSKDKQRELRQNLPEFSRLFKQDDAQEENEVSAELAAYRKRLVDEWNAWRVSCRRNVNTRGIRDGMESEVWVDEFLEEMVEILE
ncbi:eukaryotic translation initiation factor eIF2A-domain-containing protein [Mycena filopes]|nr:eukaryotic translation initiation factor eIF2A-domain-containing protein [Mycena filopes]